MPKNTRRYFEEAGKSLEGLSPDDPEFAALMRAKVGKEYQHLVTPERIKLAALLGDPKKSPYNLRGANIEGFFNDSIPILERIKQKLVNDRDYKVDYLMVGADQPMITWKDAITGIPSDKQIFGLGRGADADVFAHEFRHGAAISEDENRSQDLLNSTSLVNYQNKIDQINKYFDSGSIFRTRRGKKPSLLEQETYALDRLKTSINSHLQKYLASQGLSRDYEDAQAFLAKNIELNKAGAVGAFDASGKKLDPEFIKARAEMPFLNFVGRLEEPVERAFGSPPLGEASRAQNMLSGLEVKMKSRAGKKISQSRKELEQLVGAVRAGKRK